MPVRISLDGNTDVEARGVVLEVGGHVIRVYRVRDVGGNEEAVGVGLGEGVGVVLEGGEGGREAFDDAGDGAGEEVAVGALAQEGADFFVVEEGDNF